MSQFKNQRIGKMALYLVLAEDLTKEDLELKLKELGWLYYVGQVGSMEPNKVVAAIETAAKRNGIIVDNLYRESHALYHAIIDAMHGVTRGQFQLGDILRTVGLRFAIVRGNPYDNNSEGDWLAVALYGTIGAPVKGLEHETIGLGINHI